MFFTRSAEKLFNSKGASHLHELCELSVLAVNLPNELAKQQKVSSEKLSPLKGRLNLDLETLNMSLLHVGYLTALFSQKKNSYECPKLKDNL